MKRASLLPRWIQMPLLAAWGFLLISSSGMAQESAKPQKLLEYSRDIKPIFRQKCYSCHGALQQQASLRLDTVEWMKKGGDQGPALIPGQVDASSILERISSDDEHERMPLEAVPLTKEQIAQIREWIAQGAKVSGKDLPEPDPMDHWAFRGPQKAPLPLIPNPSGAVNPVDAFLLSKLTESGLKPRPQADQSTLLRRVTLDLIGLPPTPDELKAFLADESPNAYEKVVDRLLADPRYGERWARHWMDVWRYADWHGRRHVPDVWNSAPQIWRWRDWIVDSLNRDRGYDQMVREMLAADEIASEDPNLTVATGFLIRNWYALNPNDWMRATVEHTGKAFLGLTLNCAHCHDHKYDPITQQDYFRFRALFEPIGIRQDRLAGQADPGPFQEYNYSELRKIQRLGKVQVIDKIPTAPTWFYTGGDERNRVKEKGSAKPGVPAFLGGAQVKIEPVSLKGSAVQPWLAPDILNPLIKEHQDAIQKFQAEIPKLEADVEKALPSLREKLRQAEINYQKAREKYQGKVDALVGKQSLLLDGTKGQRALKNGQLGIKKLENGTEVTFQVLILKDAHVNFQLAKDLGKGLTDSFVGFEKGKILAYRPGGFQEFPAGTYDLAKGQNQFVVLLKLDIPKDQCLLTVKSLKDNRVLVDQVPIALNGWNPVGDPTKGIFIDCRIGSVAAFDQIEFSGPRVSGANRNQEPGPVLARFSFEPPQYPDQTDVMGIQGWEVASFAGVSGTSMATGLLDHEVARTLFEPLRMARAAVEAKTLSVTASQAGKTAAIAGLESLQARVEADRARFSGKAAPNSVELARTASERHRDFLQKKAKADVLKSQQELSAADAKPLNDAKRSVEITAAAKQLSSAREAAQKTEKEIGEKSKKETRETPDYPSVGPIYSQSSTGRRKALAEWMTHRNHPLTARVAVNHIWLRHFQVPIVATVYDFGRNGARPTHPELLDLLAVQFMESGWSMKTMHRLMVTSDAYKRVSFTGDPVVHARDPENKLYWRMNYGRMEAEVVRDSVLYLAGKLDPTIGGQELENEQALTTFRRTLYYSCQPELDGKSSLGALFDAPEPADCYRRTRSILPQQSLALTNSEFIHEMSDIVAGKLWDQLPGKSTNNPSGRTASPCGDFVEAAFLKILGRKPTLAEIKACAEFLESGPVSGTSQTDPGVAKRASLVRALLNHNDFLAIR